MKPEVDQILGLSAGQLMGQIAPLLPNSFAIGGGEHGKIDEVAAFMRGASNTLIVAGFTDERGTPEYNRGLGERRAQSVREALIKAGVDASKIQTVSFGAEMPADPGSSETARSNCSSARSSLPCRRYAWARLT